MFFKLTRAKLAIRRGDFLRALQIGGNDLAILSRLGLHLSVIGRRQFAKTRRDRIAVLASLAEMGEIDQVLTQADDVIEKSDVAARASLALALSRWNPACGISLAPPAARLERAAILLAMGDADLAAKAIGDIDIAANPRAQAIAAGIATRRGENVAARRLFADLCGRNGAFFIDVFDEGPLNLYAFRPALTQKSGGPLVSVVMAARDASGTINAAISSVLNQSWRKLELIVVDDLSGDRTAAVAAKAIGSDQRGRVMRLEKHAGPYGARNVGIAAATGGFVTFQDADDASHPMRIEEAVRALARNPQSKAHFSRLIRCNEHGLLVAPRVFPLIRANPSSLMVRREVFVEIGPFELAPFGADIEFIGRIAAIFGANSVLRSRALRSIALARPDSLTGSNISGIADRRANGARVAYYEDWFRRQARMDGVSAAYSPAVDQTSV